ncbi:MAG: putative acyl-CoA dehydrogenase [Ilumatobacteraceae bacterium]|nr:putative acyl-CoA dehydrogenase [Ilumatobacteraceae bacterium]
MSAAGMSSIERAELCQTARRVLVDRAPMGRVRALLDDPLGHDPVLYADLVRLGWTGIHVPDASGGSDGLFADVAGVLTELGRAVTATPLVSSAIIAANALVLAPNTVAAATVVPRIVDGTLMATVAFAGPGGHCSAATVGPRWTAGADGGVVIDGEATFVLDAAAADVLVVFAAGEDGIIAAVVDRTDGGITVVPTATLDQTRRPATVRFDRVAVRSEGLLAGPVDGTGLLEATVDIGATAMALDSFGIAEVVVERTADYVKQRFQFGRSIGSFQAIKHRLADAVMLVETSRVAVDNAAAAIDLESPTPSSRERTIAVATAKAYVCDAAVTICGDSLQSHGGIGFTWEHDTHLYLKRAMLNQAMFGVSSWQRRRVADAVLGPIGQTGVNRAG